VISGFRTDRRQIAPVFRQGQAIDQDAGGRDLTFAHRHGLRFERIGGRGVDLDPGDGERRVRAR
jgi:hypothetical protein